MTCPFCGIPDDRIGENHFYRHEIEALREIAKALNTLNENLDIWMPDLLEKKTK
jgi:hypothetical protein